MGSFGRLWRLCRAYAVRVFTRIGIILGNCFTWNTLPCRFAQFLRNSRVFRLPSSVFVHYFPNFIALTPFGASPTHVFAEVFAFLLVLRLLLTVIFVFLRPSLPSLPPLPLFLLLCREILPLLFLLICLFFPQFVRFYCLFSCFLPIWRSFCPSHCSLRHFDNRSGASALFGSGSGTFWVAFAVTFSCL